jgi:hypothetical protein
MKKTLLIFACLSILVAVSGQEGSKTNSVFMFSSSQKAMSDSDCPSNTYYSHQRNNAGGFTSFMDYKVYDQIETTPAGPISKITFIGFNFSYISAEQPFDIGLFKDAEGLPGIPYFTVSTNIAGEVVQWGEATIVGYTYTLPAEISVEAGDWISIYNTGDNWWFWCMANGGDGCVNQIGYGNRCDFGDAAFCLSGSGSEGVVPVSNWAIGIGLFLILSLVILRYRRSF